MTDIEQFDKLYTSLAQALVDNNANNQMGLHGLISLLAITAFQIGVTEQSLVAVVREFYRNTSTGHLLAEISSPEIH